MDILIADDHHIVREGLKFSLSTLSDNINFYESENADETMAQLQRLSKLDLVILDLFMPGANGFALFSSLMKIHPSTPIVIISAYEDPELIQKALDKGAAGYIPKSSSSSVIFTAIQHILVGGTYTPQICDHKLPTEPLDNIVKKESLLTPRQRDVLDLIISGKSNKEIAKSLLISDQTVKTHVASILKIYKVANRTQLAISSTQHIDMEMLGNE